MQQQWVVAADGTRLWVRVDGPADTTARTARTIVLTHGYAQDSRCWHHQRDELAARGVRVVTWDLRGHGRSGPLAGDDTATLDVLADDLALVIEQAGGAGPLVLVGHSMGGMVLMALARRHPDIVARTGAVGFVSTSAVGDGLGFLGLWRRFVPAVQTSARRVFTRLARHPASWAVLRLAGPLLEAAIWLTCCGWHTRRCDTRLTVTMAREAGFATMAAFLPALRQHEAAGALAVWAGTPALVLDGDHDLVVPPSDSDDIAAALPGARRVVVPRAGHNVMLAAPSRVTRELWRLAVEGCAGD